MKMKTAGPDLGGLALVGVTIAWLAGILFDSWLLLPSPALLLGAAIALLGVVYFWRIHHASQAMLCSLIALWLLLGAWRYAIASPVGDPTAISAFTGTNKLEVRGTVADEPKLAVRTRSLVVAVSSASTDNGLTWRDAHGELEVQVLGANIDDPYGPHYGDAVELHGKLLAPPPHSTPNILASMAFPRISTGQAGGNPLIATLYHLRTILATIIAQALPQPMAALLIAIVLSLRTPALKLLIPAFNVTGTAHLIAPAGFKVTILAGLVAGGTGWLYERRGKQFKLLLPAQKRGGNGQRWLTAVLVILSIAAYTFLSGGGPAAIRAGIMGILLVIAPRFGRVYNVYTALALAALLMSIFDPFVLWFCGGGDSGINFLSNLASRAS